VRSRAVRFTRTDRVFLEVGLLPPSIFSSSALRHEKTNAKAAQN